MASSLVRVARGAVVTGYRRASATPRVPVWMVMAPQYGRGTSAATISTRSFVSTLGTQQQSTIGVERPRTGRKPYTPPERRTVDSPFINRMGERHKLSEANVAAMYHNVKHWTGHGRVAPVSLLHRLLKFVETEEDLDWAMKALTQCRTRFVTFRTTTSPLLMRACCRAGRIDKAVEILEDDAGWRLFSTPSCYGYVAMAAGLEGDAALVARCRRAMAIHKVPLNKKVVRSFVKAYVDCGNIDAAVWLVRLSRAEAGVEAQQAGTYHKIFGALTQAEAEAIPVAKAADIRALAEEAKAVKWINTEVIDAGLQALQDAQELAELAAEEAAAANEGEGEGEAEGEDAAGEEGK